MKPSFLETIYPIMGPVLNIITTVNISTSFVFVIIAVSTTMLIKAPVSIFICKE